MRALVTVTVAFVALGFAACGGDSKPSATAVPPTVAQTTTTKATPTAGPRTTPAPGATAGATPATQATLPPDGTAAEVTGIVGGLNLTGNVIEIKRLQGAAVTEIAVETSTVIRKATGGRLTFKDIRTSDRIIAKGKLNDRQDQLVATEITVQDVVPGAQPGG
jgi:hypothetical protein